MSAMSFLEHLEELRKRIIWAIAAVGIAFLVCWHYSEVIYGYMQKPIMEALQRNNLSTKLTYLNPTEPFNMYMKIGLITALFVASPFVLYQLWAFVAPGLYRNEKKYVVPFMVLSVGLFLGGGYFGYKVVFPAALPTIFTGIRIAGAAAVLVLIAAEMIGATAGLGYYINYAQNNFLIAPMYAAILTTSALGLAVNYGLVALERRLSRWRA